MKKKYWWALFAALTLTVAGCSSDGSDDAVDSVPEESTTTTTEAVVESEDEDEPQPDVATVEFVADASVLEAAFEPIDAGVWRVDAMGTPFSVDIADGWEVHPNEPALLAFGTQSTQGPGDNDIAFLRVHGLADPENYGALAEDVDNPWDASDIEGWLAAMPDGLVSEGPESTTVGGRDAVVFTVDLEDDSLCGDNGFCVGFTGNSSLGFFYAFELGIASTVYWVDMGDFDPVAIIIGDNKTTDDHRARSEALIETIAFGEPVANPVPQSEAPWEIGFAGEAPAGVIELPIAGGVAFDTAAPSFVFNNGPGHAGFSPEGFVPGGVELITPISGGGVDTIASTDDLMTALEAIGADAEITGTVDVRLGTATVIDLTSDSQGGPPPEEPTIEDIGLLTAAGEEFGWRPPQLGRMWVFDSDRGMVAVSAESYEGDPELFDEMVLLAEGVVGSLRLVDTPDGALPTTLDAALDGEPSGDGVTLPAGDYVSTNLTTNMLLQLDEDAGLKDIIPDLIGMGPDGMSNNEAVAIFTAVGVPGDGADPQPMPDDLETYFLGRSDLTVGNSGTITASGVDARWWDLNTTDGQVTRRAARSERAPRSSSTTRSARSSSATSGTCD